MKLILFILIITPAYAFGQLEKSNGSGWSEYELSSLTATLKKRMSENPKQNYLRFHDSESMSTGIYFLPKGGTDEQNPHGLDEIYYIVSGKAKLKAGEKSSEVSGGDVIYVEDKITHYFYDITEDLTVFVFFSKSDPSKNDPDAQFFTNEEINVGKDPNKNVWNQFVDVSSLRTGNYMLPKKIGGDETLIHEVDEINLVLKGQGKFRMGDDSIDVQPGSIMYVEKGIGHNFYDLKSESLDILIIFVK